MQRGRNYPQSILDRDAQRVWAQMEGYGIVLPRAGMGLTLPTYAEVLQMRKRLDRIKEREGARDKRQQQKQGHGQEVTQAFQTGVEQWDNARIVAQRGFHTGNQGDSEADAVITDGSHYVDGKLKPNLTYKTGEHGYTYKTNGDGVISEAHADLQFKTHNGRLNHNPSTPGKLPGDHAGHLFGDRFGGSPELDNLVSQAQKVNQSEYKILENQWARALKNGQDVNVDIKINYDIGGVRPTSFDVKYTIDAMPFRKTITN